MYYSIRSVSCCGCISSTGDIRALLKSKGELEFLQKLKIIYYCCTAHSCTCVCGCLCVQARLDLNDNRGSDPERCFTAVTLFSLRISFVNPHPAFSLSQLQPNPVSYSALRHYQQSAGEKEHAETQALRPIYTQCSAKHSSHIRNKQLLVMNKKSQPSGRLNLRLLHCSFT